MDAFLCLVQWFQQHNSCNRANNGGSNEKRKFETQDGLQKSPDQEMQNRTIRPAPLPPCAHTRLSLPLGKHSKTLMQRKNIAFLAGSPAVTFWSSRDMNLKPRVFQLRGGVTIAHTCRAVPKTHAC